MKSQDSIIEEALMREKAVRIRRMEETHIVEDLPDIPLEIPDWLYPEKKKSLLSYFNLLLI